jgi:dipeptidyl aminopeptidase/acylaminoacyl peptidase
MSKVRISENRPLRAFKPGVVLLMTWLIASPLARRTSAQLSGQDQVPLPIRETISARDFGYLTPLALSPNGLLVSYTLKRPHRTEPLGWHKPFSPTGVPRGLENTEVWLTNIQTGVTKNLTGSTHSAWSPSWSPDGRRLAFYSDQGQKTQVWIWDSVTEQTRPASLRTACPFWGFEVPRWTSDSQYILVKLMPQHLTHADIRLITGVSPVQNASPLTSGVTATIFGGVATAKVASDASDRELGDLALIDVATGSALQIASHANTRGYWISPDSASIAYARMMPPDPNTQRNLFEIVLVDVRSRATRVLASSVDMDWGTGVSWSPNGKLLSFLTGEVSFKTSAPRVPGDCYLVSVDTGAVGKATYMPHADFGHPRRAPIWDPSGKFLYVLTQDALWKIEASTHNLERLSGPIGRTLLEIATSSETNQLILIDGKYAVLMVRDRASRKEGFWRLDLLSGVANPLGEQSQSVGATEQSVYRIAASADGRRIVYVSEAAQRPRDLWVLDTALDKYTRLTAINPFFDQYALGRTRLVSYQSDTGDTLHGALLLPSTYREGLRYPTIVYVYGGSFLSERVNQFGLGFSGVDNMQLFATRGYTVLFLDTPLGLGTPMRDLANSVLPALNKVVELGFADPDRIGLMGHSYGGYSVLALIVQTARFRAAVARGAQGDLVSTYGVMSPDGYPSEVGWAEYGQGRMGGTPWQYRDRYIENSPVFFLDRVTTPLLLVQGETDNTVPAASAEEVFVGLRRLGKEVVYAKYAGEGHYEDDWSYFNRIDYLQRIVSWFDSHLKTSSPGPNRDK